MKKKINISGMHCANCSRRVENALAAFPGAQVTVDLAGGFAIVAATQSIPDAALTEAIEALGFDCLGIDQLV